MDYIPSNTFHKHIDLAEVNGFEFYGCDFSSMDVPGVASTCTGIASYGSGFGVHPRCVSGDTPCSQIDQSTFTGFYKGIYQTNEQTYPFVVDNALFSDNVYGIKVVNTDNYVVLNSDFHIAQNLIDTETCSDVSLMPSGYGIYSERSNGYAVEKNYFTKLASAPNDIYTGVCMKNAIAINEVTNNEFENLTYGNLAIYQNFLTNDRKYGLCYFCNENDSNYADFYVHGRKDSNDDGIQSKQGNDQLAAGNTFSSSARWHFYNGGDHLVGYYYYVNGVNENPDDDKIRFVTDKDIPTENTCEDHYVEVKSTSNDTYSVHLTDTQASDAMVQYANDQNDLASVTQQYEALVDGGNTTATLVDVETANSQDMWSLRSDLLGKSPHLSMEVLKSVTDRTDVFPDDILLEILSANPDELRNKELIEYIENSPDPLPDYMIEILKQVANGSTYKTALECQMSWLNSSRARNANDIIRSIKNEESVNLTSLRNWLDNLGGEAADIAIIKSFMEENNYTDAMSLANMLPQLYDYNADQLVEHDYFIDMIDLHHDLYQTNRNIFQLNSQEVAELYTIATTSNSTAGTEAKGILSALYGYHFCDCLEISDSTAYKSSQSVLFPEIMSTKLFNINFNPNPASSWTNITYELPSIDSQAVLVIYDQYGREIERFNLEGQSGSFTWDTRSTESGIYIYRLFLNDESISGRILVN